MKKEFLLGLIILSATNSLHASSWATWLFSKFTPYNFITNNMPEEDEQLEWALKESEKDQHKETQEQIDAFIMFKENQQLALKVKKHEEKLAAKKTSSKIEDSSEISSRLDAMKRALEEISQERQIIEESVSDQVARESKTGLDITELKNKNPEVIAIQNKYNRLLQEIFIYENILKKTSSPRA